MAQHITEEILERLWGAWRYRWAALGTAALVAALGWLIVFALPDKYEAGASIFVDTRTPLKPALQGLTVEQDVNSQLNFVRQALLAGPQLERIAIESGLLPAAGISSAQAERMLYSLRNRIQFTVRSASDREDERTTAGSIYSITFQDSDRMRAFRLVRTLLDTLVNETLGGKREGAQEAQQFLQSQITDYERRLRAAEDRLADFKSKHMGVMPSEQGGYFAELQKENDAIEQTRTKLRTAESRRTTLENQLHGDAALSAPAVSAAGGQGRSIATDTLSRIAETQAHLDELLLRFTDRHPDVIATRQALVDLKKRRAAELESLRRGDTGAAAASGVAANPVYQSIQLALNQAEVDISDLRTELSEHQAKAADLRRLLNTAPQVEAEFAQLTRDYDVNKAQYTALLSSFEKARLGERADNAGSVRFEVVQPPSATVTPVSPHRSLLLAGVLGAALAAGLALAYGLDQLFPVVGSATRLTELTGVTVLGVIGSAFPQRQRRAFNSQLRRVAVLAACLLIAFAITLIMSQAGLRLNLPILTQRGIV